MFRIHKMYIDLDTFYILNDCLVFYAVSAIFQPNNVYSNARYTKNVIL